ncbi:MAG: cell division protein ZapA [Lachnospiraceae bacterium]|jgi:cell division protein ZapA|nr:cell division protein ZapA [Lachnospiraceae bacterium]
MAIKTDTEVIIGGKVFTISGTESEEYLQKVASYINGKFNEYAQVEGFRRANAENQNVLMQLNIADDYFKAMNRISSMEEDMSAKEKELYDLKHDLVNAQMKLENMDKSLKILRDEGAEKDKKIVRLETELKALKKS